MLIIVVVVGMGWCLITMWWWLSHSRDDIHKLDSVFGPQVGTTPNVKRYYTETTDRDYRWLAWFVGGGMHTQLTAPAPIGTAGGGTRQPALVLAEVRAVDARTVLEIGCGRGYCSLFLAALCPDVMFVGIDMLPRHVKAARAEAHRMGLTNVTFRIGHANDVTGQYDVVFGCEALCYLDTTERRRFFLKRLCHCLRRGGRLVIVDGFRSPTFDVCPERQRRAMQWAEWAFCIRAMPTREQWTSAHANFEVVRELNLTSEALPFWSLGRRLARWIPPQWVRWYARSAPRRAETARNWAAALTVAEAMKNGAAAEYYLLVLQKRGRR